ncbi:MAG: SpoIIE family protein phosphatase [Candidatus Eisenbacteria bacterium]
MPQSCGTSSPHLGWRYLLLTLLTLIVTAQLVGSLWTLTKIARGLNVGSLGINGAIYGTLTDFQWIRSEGGAPVTNVRSPSTAETAGIQKGDVIVAVNGVTLVEHPEAMVQAIMNARVGDSLALRWMRGAEAHEAFVPLEPPRSKGAYLRAGKSEIRMRPGAMFWLMFGPTVLLAAPFLFAGALIGFLRPGVSVAFQTAVLFLCIGVYCFLEDLPGLAVWPAWVLGLSVAVTRLSLFVFPPLFLRIMAVFPNPSRLGERVLRYLWAPSLLLGIVAPVAVLGGIAPIYRWADRWTSFLPWFRRDIRLESIVLVTICVPGLALWIAQRIEARGSGRAKQRLLEFGLLTAFLGSIWRVFPPTELIWKLFHPQGSILPMVVLFLQWFGWILLIACLPLSFAYAVLAHRVFGVRVILRKGVRYLLLSRGVLIVEGLLLFFIIEETIRHGQSRLAASIPAVAGLSAISSVLVMTGLVCANRPLMHRIDKRFFRESYDARRVLLTLGEGISRLREKNEILKRAGEAIASTLHPSRVAIFLKEPERQAPSLAWESASRVPPRGGPAARGSSAPTHQPVLMHLLVGGAPWSDIPHEEDDAGMDSAPASSGPFELLIAIRSSAGLAGCMALAAKLSEEPFSREDKELLVTVAAQMGLAIENAELLEVAKREAEQARDLAIARQVQQNLFPKELPRAEGWEFAAVCRPAKAVGGDYYDLFAIDAEHIALALGDVSGKGIGPSMLMSSAHTLIRSRLRQRGTGLADLVRELNEHLYASTSPEMFITLFVGILDLRTAELRYVNAGHNPPLVFAGPEAPPARLFAGGIMVGIVPEVSFEEGTLSIATGSLLAIYSDGITEAIDAAGGMFEEARLIRVLDESGRVSASGILALVLESVDRFSSGCEQADDISLLIIRRLEPSATI